MGVALHLGRRGRGDRGSARCRSPGHDDDGRTLDEAAACSGSSSSPRSRPSRPHPLPAVTAIAGQAGASAIAGESIGTFAAIAIGWGWATVGPALISIAADDDERARLYRESIAVRLSISILALPALAVICWFVASPGSEWLTI